MDAWIRGWVTSALIGLTVGCASDRPRTIQLSHYASSTPPPAAALPANIATAAQPEPTAAQPEPTVVQPEPTVAAVGLVQYQTPAPLAEPAQAMTLEQMLAIAFENNPAIRELAATTQKAAGYRTQVGLYANPLIGYSGETVSHGETDEHLAFIEQVIVTGGKLQLNRAVLNEAVRAQVQELEAHKLRVATDIKTGFYQSLQYQQQLAAMEQFSQRLVQGVRMAEQRMQAGEGSKIDLLQTRLQLQQFQLQQRQAESSLVAKRHQLAALAGVPQWQAGELAGEFPAEPTAIDWETLPATLIAASPEYAAAQAHIRKAALAVQRHRIQPIPNLHVQLAAGRDQAVDADMLTFEVAAPVPLFNRNQGNVAAARAEYCRAIAAAQRIENDIQARLAETAAEYQHAAEAVEAYQHQLLPAAGETLELAEAAYRAGEQDFIQLLVTRRTYLDTLLGSIDARAQLAIAQAHIDGCLLSGALQAVIDDSGETGLRELALSQE